MRRKNIVALASRITEKAHKLIVRELESYGVNGLVPSHGGILGLLFSGEKLTMKDLADRINRTKPTVTVLVDKLVVLGYVTKEKSHTDSRVTYIDLTDKGKELEPIFVAVSKRLNEAVYKDLSDSEAKLVEQALEKIKLNLE